MACSGGKNRLQTPSMLEQLLEEINFQRTKEMRQLLTTKDGNLVDSGFVMLQGTTYWTDLFVRHFLFQAEHTIDGDDLLFFVRKKHVKTSSRYLPKFETEVDVFRKDSKKLPIGDPDIDWEETVYLNLVVHQFDYTLTLAICTRTSPKELQVLRRHSQKVYASPSHRRMDAKGDLEEMTYPHICFMVDNFDEVFCDILVRDGEMVCVELVASDRQGAVQGVIFLGSIRYDALKKVYDARSSLSTKMAQRMTFGLFSGATTQRVEFVRMKGPKGKGHAEMAVTKPKGSGAETPTSEPGYCLTDALGDADWDDAEELFLYRHQRRLSDPSSNLNNFVRGGWRTKPESAAAKARSENEGLDSIANGLSEIEAGDLKDGEKMSKEPEEEGRGGGHWPSAGTPRRVTGTRSAQSSPAAVRRNCARPHHNRPASCYASSRSPLLLSKRDRTCSDAAPPCGLKSQISMENEEEEPQSHQPIEVGSEMGTSPTNDKRVRQKLGTGAILVNGKEELPCCDNENQEPTAGEEAQTRSQRLAERRRGRSRSLIHEKTTHLSSSFEDATHHHPLNGCNEDDETAKANGNDVADTTSPCPPERSATLPRRRRRRAYSSSLGAQPLPPHRVTPDGTAIYYWCDRELDDGAYNPLWTMRGFTQTFHFWKETKRAQSTPLNAFLTYIRLPWWSIAKDILDHREGPILTF
ncbi:uncharacterized protein LOC106636986 isoform X2 [Copidosoma floridanum]|uniref:uncharacterized protein LOC106636986 isoform X2 n=1 Tax=Copidosoma floridanum TaxID=29053 RepID=UPI000C6F99D1|nr:uncharacterized protein LOC106636986 isoform X2 [Copidosoma floridanum]